MRKVRVIVFVQVDYWDEENSLHEYLKTYIIRDESVDMSLGRLAGPTAHPTCLLGVRGLALHVPN